MNYVIAKKMRSNSRQIKQMAGKQTPNCGECDEESLKQNYYLN